MHSLVADIVLTPPVILIALILCAAMLLTFYLCYIFDAIKYPEDEIEIKEPDHFPTSAPTDDEHPN